MLDMNTIFEKIKSICDQNLTNLYPHNIPDTILERYQQELKYLKDSKYIYAFDVFRLLSEEAKRNNVSFGVRGTLTGSLIYYLLSENSYNPMQAHYYCGTCGYYEEVDTNLFGIDLPDKICPCCGKAIYGDGFNIPIESVWGNDGKKIIGFDCNVSSKFYPIARALLEREYSEYVNEIDDYHTMEVSSVMDMLDELRCKNPSLVNVSIHKILKNISWEQILDVLKSLDDCGLSMYQMFNPYTFSEMVNAEACVRNTYSWKEDEETVISKYKAMVNQTDFQKYPCHTREDFFECLIEAGVDRTYAFDVSEKIRKGYGGIESRKEYFGALGMPEYIKNISRNYSYVCSRAQCVDSMIRYALMAYLKFYS